MRDQADTLRKLMQERKPATRSSSTTTQAGYPTRVLTFASGKGGVGKSCLVSNLGTLLARSGLRVLLVDGDFGLANLDIMLGVPSPTVTLEHVLSGQARLQDAVIGVEPNLWLLPASAGLMEIRDGGCSDTRERLSEIFEACPWQMDLILVDIGAGIQSNVLSLHDPLYKSVIVVNPEPTSMTDAYGLIKLLRRHAGVSEVSVIVNRVTDGREGGRTFQKLKEVVDRFLDVRMEYLGHCPQDEKITQSVMKRKILLDWNAEARSIPSMELLVKHLRSRFLHEAGAESGRVGFWRTLLREKAPLWGNEAGNATTMRLKG